MLTKGDSSACFIRVNQLIYHHKGRSLIRDSYISLSTVGQNKRDFKENEHPFDLHS